MHNIALILAGAQCFGVGYAEQALTDQSQQRAMLEGRMSPKLAYMLSHSVACASRQNSPASMKRKGKAVRNPQTIFSKFLQVFHPAHSYILCGPWVRFSRDGPAGATSGAPVFATQINLDRHVVGNCRSNQALVSCCLVDSTRNEPPFMLPRARVKAINMAAKDVGSAHGVGSQECSFFEDPLRFSRRDMLSAAIALALGVQLSADRVLALTGSEVQDIRLRSGFKMPLIGLGTWESAPGEVGSAVQAALDAGCRHIDCAAAYRNEAEVGAAIRSSNIPREEIFITSKLWNDKRRPADVRDALEKTLKRLGTDYLDLYLIHWPVVWAKDSVMKPDPQASLKAAWQTLEQLMDEKKIRNIGISNFNEKEIAELLSYCRIPPAVNQIELHPKLPQRDLVKFCQSKGIEVTAYSPLGRGSIKGAGLLNSLIVRQIATTHSVSPASVLLRWGIQRGIVVIPKSVNPERIRQNVQEPWTFQLNTEEVAALDMLEDGSRFVTAPWSTFADRTESDQALTALLTLLARGVFSVASLDVTK